MNEEAQSILLAPAGLYLPLVAALVLTFVRTPRSNGQSNAQSSCNMRVDSLSDLGIYQEKSSDLVIFTPIFR
jgi:hypothetical protein